MLNKHGRRIVVLFTLFIRINCCCCYFHFLFFIIMTVSRLWTIGPGNLGSPLKTVEQILWSSRNQAALIGSGSSMLFIISATASNGQIYDRVPLTRQEDIYIIAINNHHNKQSIKQYLAMSRLRLGLVRVIFWPLPRKSRRLSCSGTRMTS